MKWQEIKEKQDELRAQVEKPPFRCLEVNADGSIEFRDTDDQPLLLYPEECVRLGRWLLSVFDDMEFYDDVDSDFYGEPLQKEQWRQEAYKELECEKKTENVPNRQLKVGDLVKILAEPDEDHKVGSIGKVVGIMETDLLHPYLVEVGKRIGYYAEEELELIITIDEKNGVGE